MPPRDHWTGRCYCGASGVLAQGAPLTVSYCHCEDCRRVTGAPVAAFCAFPTKAVTLTPDRTPAQATPGVQRWFCPACGSPLAASFDYLPDQIYVPIGILDQAADLPPARHSHMNACLPWLTITDDLPRDGASGRSALRAAGDGA